jgi:hypothetical protein
MICRLFRGEGLGLAFSLYCAILLTLGSPASDARGTKLAPKTPGAVLVVQHLEKVNGG